MTTVQSPLGHSPNANEQLSLSHPSTRDIPEKASPSYPAAPTNEKDEGVPFTLTLQEEKSNPGQFRLVVNINGNNNGADNDGGGDTGNHPPRKLYLNPQSLPSLGYDVSSLYRTQKSSPPTSPQERQGWSDLDAIPPDFLKKVVPDWGVNLDRNASTASNQSRRLSDIKARIKKSGKGFVIRLLKGVNSESNEVAEVHLTHQAADIAELDGTPQAELDGAVHVGSSQQISLNDLNTVSAGQTEIFEIGTSSEMGVRKPLQSPQAIPQLAPPSCLAVPRWLTQTHNVASSRNSVGDDSFSDAETLISDARRRSNSWEEVDDDATDLEPASIMTSRLPTRSASVSSVMPTPTRGLSVVGPVRRVKQSERSRNATGPLNRSHAKKSFKRKSPRNPSWDSRTPLQSDYTKDTTLDRVAFDQHTSVDTRSFDEPPSDVSTWHHPAQTTRRGTVVRHYSLEIPSQNRKQRKRPKLQTKDEPQHHSASSSPASLHRRSPRSAQSERTPTGDSEPARPPRNVSPVHDHVDDAQKLRTALEKVLQEKEEDAEPEVANDSGVQLNVQPPDIDDDVGEMFLPPDLEIRQPSTQSRSPLITFVYLACSALSSKIFEGVSLLQDAYGSEPSVPHNHVRVRWTCSCGEQLYDDFVEKKRGAARLLEAFLNRPRTHTPASGRSSTSSSMSSVFSSTSTTSTLATPLSTYGGFGSQSWGQGDRSGYSPTTLRSNNPFSVRIGSYPDAQWLLTCANEGRYTPKIVHLDVNPGRIKSDKDFALALREHYSNLNRKLFRVLKLRGLITIDFVQFEVHRNRFADIRKSPDMPSTKSDYDFEPVDLVPPVGSRYLLHLFKHPEDYDGELITYLRSPKRRSRLDFGVGWGINLVEGFMADRVWSLIMSFFIVGSVVFAVVWACKRGNDVQGAFGVAGWIMTLAALAVGWVQAWLE